MKNKSFLTAFFFAITIFAIQISAQTITYRQNNDDLNRPRVINGAKTKQTFTFSAAQIHAFEKEVFQLINKKREEKGLIALEWSDDVAEMARFHSENMAKFNFFSHSGKDGKMVDGRADSFGIKKWSAIGENIAFNRGFENPLEIAVEKWLLSPTHRENLLDSRWKETGIGIAVTENGTYYFTQVFLKRR